MNKEKWDLTCMRLAYEVAQHATCLRRKVGAVISKDYRIIATGFNGAPEGIEHCTTCMRDVLNVPSGQRHELSMAVHAEMNAIIQCALHGVSPEGSTIYVTVTPCSMCLKALINARIKRIVIDNDVYPDELSRKLLNESGIEFVVLKSNKNKKSRKELEELFKPATRKEDESGIKHNEMNVISYPSIVNIPNLPNIDEVEKWLKSEGIPFNIEKLDPKIILPESGISIEELTNIKSNFNKTFNEWKEKFFNYKQSILTSNDKNSSSELHDIGNKVSNKIQTPIVIFEDKPEEFINVYQEIGKALASDLSETIEKEMQDYFNSIDYKSKLKFKVVSESEAKILVGSKKNLIRHYYTSTLNSNFKPPQYFCPMNENDEPIFIEQSLLVALFELFINGVFEVSIEFLNNGKFEILYDKSVYRTNIKSNKVFCEITTPFITTVYDGISENIEQDRFMNIIFKTDNISKEFMVD